MPDTIAPLQNRSTVLSDFTKQIVTVSSAALALTATFATGIFSGSPTGAQLFSIGAAGGLLFLATCCALVSHARIIAYLKASADKDATQITKTWNASAFWANGGFFLFGLALLSLLVFGFLRLTTQTIDAVSAVATSAKFLTDRGKIQGSSDWTSFALTGDEYEVRFRSGAGTDHVCTVSAETGKLLRCE